MKKIILSAAALFVFGFASAQDLKFGAKAGVNFANLTSNYSDLYETSDNSMKIGFHVGGFVEIKFSEKFALQPELLFSTQGTTTKSNSIDFGDGETSSSESKINLAYVNVPIMVKFYPIEKFFIEAGPQVGFLVSANSKDSGSDTFYNGNNDLVTESYDTDVDVKDYYKSIDFGINFGVGYEFTENLFANVRYNLGLSNISEVPDSLDGFDFGVFGSAFTEKNQVIQLSIGYKF